MTEFDKLFQDNLKDGESKPPPFVWDNIENEIKKDTRRNKKFFFLWSLSFLAILLSSTVLYYWMGQPFRQINVSEQNLSAEQENQVSQTVDAGKALSILEMQGEEANLVHPNTKEGSTKENVKRRVDRFGNSLEKSERIKDIKLPTTTEGAVSSAVSGDIEKANGLSKSKEEEGAVSSAVSGDIEKANGLSKSKEEEGAVISAVSGDIEKANGLSKSKEEEGAVSGAVSGDIEKANGLSKSKEEEGAVNSAVSGDIENANKLSKEGKSITEDSIPMEIKDVPVLLAEVAQLVTKPIFIEDKDMMLFLASDTTIEKAEEQKTKSKKFFVEARVGYSNYKMSLWKNSFHFGDLSNRKFKSSGVNVNVTLGYQIKSWLNPIIGFNYNNKQAAFNYSALYDDDSYLSHNINGNKISLDQINDIDSLCNQYVLTDIEAAFNIGTVSVTLGNRFNLLQLKRVGIELDLSYSLEFISSINVNSISKIDVSENLTETFNSKIAAGLNINYKLSEQFKLFIHAEYIFKPYNSNNFHRSDAHELINSIGLRLNF